MLKWWCQNPITEASKHPGVFQLLYADPDLELWSYYIEGAPCFILFNYSDPHEISNGPGCIYHSLVLGDAFDTVEEKNIKKK